MKSDDREQISTPLADISQEKRNAIAEKILYRKSLNAVDRQTIYFVLSGEWEPVSFFRGKRGPKNNSKNLIALAEDVEEIKADGLRIIDHMSALGEEHHLQGGGNVGRDTFNKNLKNGRKYLANRRLFFKTLDSRKSKKSLPRVID
jgi:hypothetical protein